MANPQTLPSTRTLLLGISAHISRGRRIQLGLLLVLMVANGGAELVSLGAVLPFLAVISDQEQLWQQPLVQALAIKFNWTSASDLLLPVTLSFVIATVFAALIRVANLWLSGRLAAALGTDLSSEAYERTLYQPYRVHVQRNTAQVINAIGQIGPTVAALNSLLLLTTSVLVAVALFTGLLLIDAPVALTAAGLFGSVYVALAFISKRELHSNGQKITEASSLQVKVIQEGLGAIRDVLLDGSQSTYLQIYRQADHPLRKLQARNSFIAGFPRFALEALGMVAIALLGGLLVHQRASSAAVIPLLGALALGAQRLLPALQQIYNGWVNLQGNKAALGVVLGMLKQPYSLQASVAEPLLLHKAINLKGVHFCYGPDQPEVLYGLDLEIRRGERIGLIGGTGSGKTTTVDLLMGLLEPTVGRLLVDGDDLYDPKHPQRLAAWRAAIAHVPQVIYLADSSIAENIAFGVPPHQIDMERVIAAASQAQIASFIETSVDGYQSFVGERGIRLSGGQRQRIGIARALYKRAEVLVLDEATSSLDIGTEEAVMSAVEGLSKQLTIVMIAHRLSTVQRCDRVVRLADGAVSADGSPQEILKL